MGQRTALTQDGKPKSMTTRFALIGAAGFVAPRHMEAIKDVGGELVAAMDPHDSVGILDRHFPQCEFFTDQARFERHLNRLAETSEGVDYLAVCSPNHLHDTHVRLGLYAGCHVICEKPVVLNPDNLDLLQTAERQSSRKVFPVLQLRLHPEVAALKKRLEDGKHYEVKLDYRTPRGRWYASSWKGDEAKSGGVLTNIGVHMFDLLIELFGNPLEAAVASQTAETVEGALRLPRATVRWTLSIAPGAPTRSLHIGTQPIDLSTGFETAHNEVYQQIMKGNAPGLMSARPAIELCWALRQLPADGQWHHRIKWPGVSR